jgi:flagellar biosynthesis/type III secretory pathway chaperone
MEGTFETILREEIALLEELIASLRQERQAIVSFSLEGLTKVNEERQEILRRLHLLEERRRGLEPRGPEDRNLLDRLRPLVSEALSRMERNRDLLSFCIGHVERSIERILTFLRREGAGEKDRLSLFVSREV